MNRQQRASRSAVTAARSGESVKGGRVMRTRIGGEIRTKFVAVAIAVAAVVAFTLPAQAQAQVWNPKVAGKTYGEWETAWWQWAFAGPNGENVIEGTAECGVNQPPGPVWFLAGTFGVVAERDCTIPKDRAVFYPLVNSFWVDCPNSPDEDLTDDEVRALMATYGGGGDKACQLTSTLDGVAISTKQSPTVRSQSPTFTATLPEGHVLEGLCYFPPDYPTDLPPGKTGRMISEGYWIMLPPLSSGEHTLTLHGANCDPATGAVEFEVDVTYHLTVN